MNNWSWMSGFLFWLIFAVGIGLIVFGIAYGAHRSGDGR